MTLTLSKGGYFAEKEYPPLLINRFFTTDDDYYTQDIFATVEWLRTKAEIKDSEGKILFSQEVEFPSDWSQTAINIVSSKYFKSIDGEREHSLQQLIGRIVNTINEWGQEFGYFRNNDESSIFQTELTHILLNQFACFNSPIWFNLGVPGRDPQVSACFLLDVEDNMESILQHGVTEGRIFKGGSGSGVNISKLRAEGASLSAGGTSSGPMSFVRGWDKMAGAIKSGGTTRRAARLVVMDCDHPDIDKFVSSKAIEEEKAGVLVAAGYDGSIDGDAYDTVAYQNANHSVMVTDEFMGIANSEHDSPESQLLNQIADAAWQCGDPGLLFYDTINRWNPVPKDGDIRTANPCCEFFHLPLTSCNLSSLNLTKYIYEGKRIDLVALAHVASIMTIAQDITIEGGSFPTDEIKEATKKYRPIGVGFTNLGGLLMSLGIAYNSEVGRELAALIQATITGAALLQSTELAQRLSPFNNYDRHNDDMKEIVSKHQYYAGGIDTTVLESYVSQADMYQFTYSMWNEIIDAMSNYGLRNSYVTNIAPTGTISFFMDSDTTGIEPYIALKAEKSFVGGGKSILVNNSIPDALDNLGYNYDESWEIINDILDGVAVDEINLLESEHRDVFLTALPDYKGKSLDPSAHIDMVAAVQPFLSGGVSKTINCSSNATVDDIRAIYIDAWKKGLKAVSIYRDNSKVNQPMKTIKIILDDDQPKFEWGQNIPPDTSGYGLETEYDGTAKPEDVELHVDDIKKSFDPIWIDLGKKDLTGRVVGDENEWQFKLDKEGTVKLERSVEIPNDIFSLRHKFTIGQTTGYIHIGYYQNRVVEVFINVARDGTTMSGLGNALGILMSTALQAGVSIDELKSRLGDLTFEPQGMTNNKEIPFTSSLVDYVVRLIELQQVKSQNSTPTEDIRIPVVQQGNKFPEGTDMWNPPKKTPVATFDGNVEDAEEEENPFLAKEVVSRNIGSMCSLCGGQMIITGTCSTCTSCGTQGGC